MADRATRVRSLAAVVSVACWWLIAAEAMAADPEVSFSGYGTVGYARSDRSYRYDQYIDDHGTFLRDSVAGLQLDAKAFNDFGATIQVKAAPFTTRDNRFTVSLPWAFLSYRPTNDWLFRIGKQRIPFYLYSETLDVGASYEFARLPIEMYSIAPSNDFVGGSFARTLHLFRGELTIGGYYGRSTSVFRSWQRDTVPGIQEAGALFTHLDFNGGGFVASYRDDDVHLRVGAAQARIRLDNGSPLGANFPFVQVAPGIGYYQVSNEQPGPGVETTPSIPITLVTVGADIALPAGVRGIGEFARTIERNSKVSPRGNRGYVSFLRPVARWTPYVSYAFEKSPQFQLDAYTAVNDNTVPAFIPGAALINASQRVAADQFLAYDQSSRAIGTSYSVTPTSKMKAEFNLTRIGTVSQLVDAPPGGTPSHEKIKIFSLSYSAVFQ